MLWSGSPTPIAISVPIPSDIYSSYDLPITVAVTLSPEETRELFNLYSRVREFLATLREESPVAGYLKMPQVPVVLSESLAAILIRTGSVKLPGIRSKDILSVVRGGEGGADLTVTLVSGKQYGVEVKATADKEFIQLTKRDLLADYFLWILFRDVFDRRGRSPVINVLVVCQPGDVLSPGKVTFQKMTSQGLKHFALVSVDLDDVI